MADSKKKPKPDTLSSRTILQIKEKIEAEGLRPGDKLPTLNDLALEFGVSRTVIREAVIALSSDNLLESRHGVGIFLKVGPAGGLQDADGHAGAIGPLKASVPFMDLLELRMAFEVHAAGLAATRRSWGQEAAIWEAMVALETAMQENGALDDCDTAFHRCIVEATNNMAFVEFFQQMWPSMLPRPAFSPEMNPTLITPAYLDHTVQEHRAIYDAISAGDPDAARDAMRAHLQRSHKRYRGFRDQHRSPLSNVAED